MKVIIRATVKGRGSITWPPVEEPADDETREKLRDVIRDHAAKTRTALGVTYATTTVEVTVAFRPDIVVEGL